MVPHAPIGYGPPMIRHARHHDRISIDPAVMLGKPVIRGTRITVEQILREFGAGMATEGTLAAHPRLTVDDIRAAVLAHEAAKSEIAPASLRSSAEPYFRDRFRERLKQLVEQALRHA